MSDPIDLDSEVERLRAENGDMRWRLNQLEPLAKTFAAERDDARLALAMARGEGWPEGWARYGLTWWSPDEQTRILHGERFVPGGTEPTWTLERGSRCVVTHHPDALSALRAHQAKMTP